ncbi:MAG: DeoR family transcriptional regulator [Rhodobacteraceae bacterium CG17_big_fil_post_rev_8_21_14_2_50_65_11]|nr:MAG: DeoR family transcriptional regulator [Rhodobacteraceae bacterium CG17_big_fil_post_rev_8_21_14_2_50_65_11]
MGVFKHSEFVLRRAPDGFDCLAMAFVLALKRKQLAEISMPTKHSTSRARRQEILHCLRQNGRIEVETLAEHLETTPQTIRKDLNFLAEEGKIIRFHGGASLLAGVEYTAFDIRKEVAAEQKERIGRALARRIPNNCSIFLNSGTTTAAVARHLSQHAGLLVVTDSVHLADLMRTYSGLEVIVPGGSIRQSDGAILGDMAVDFIRQFRADYAIIGAAAIGADGALLDFDLREASLARAFIGSARRIILAADSSKAGGTAPVCIGHLDQVHEFFTDDGLQEDLRRMCHDLGVECITAD